jgi:hypothetical protein
LRRRSSSRWWSYRSRSRRNKAWTNPRTAFGGRVNVKGNARHKVNFFLPTMGKRRDGGMIRPVGLDKSLLSGCEAHGSLAPIRHVGLVVQAKVLPKLPSSSLLLSSSGRIVRQVGIAIVVEEARHSIRCSSMMVGGCLLRYSLSLKMNARRFLLCGVEGSSLGDGGGRALVGIECCLLTVNAILLGPNFTLSFLFVWRGQLHAMTQEKFSLCHTKSV